MIEAEKIKVAIVDYYVGNVFSVIHACKQVGLQANLTSSPQEILNADLVILPGVGAFGDAMVALKKLDLISPLRDVAASQKFLIGVCLGMQLLMTESYEFGHHQGLGIIEGSVLKFDKPMQASRNLKVPQVGWNRIYSHSDQNQPRANDKVITWQKTPLSELSEGEFMYFVHSFYVKPENSDMILSTSHYGHIEFCSSLRHQNVFACQFHPERSGIQGLHIYQNFVSLIQEQKAMEK